MYQHNQKHFNNNLWTRLFQRLSLFLLVITILTGVTVSSISPYEPYEPRYKPYKYQDKASSMVERPIESARQKARTGAYMASDGMEAASGGLSEAADTAIDTGRKATKRAWNYGTKPFQRGSEAVGDFASMASDGVEAAGDNLADAANRAAKTGRKSKEFVDSTAYGVAKTGCKACAKAWNIGEKPIERGSELVEDFAGMTSDGMEVASDGLSMAADTAAKTGRKSKEFVGSTAHGTAKTGCKACANAWKYGKIPFQKGGEVVGDFASMASNGMEAAGDGIADAADSAIDTGSEVTKTALEYGKKPFQVGGKVVGNGVKAAGNGIADAADSAVDTGRRATRRAWNAVKRPFQVGGKVVGNGMRAAGDGLVAAADTTDEEIATR